MPSTSRAATRDPFNRILSKKTPWKPWRSPHRFWKCSASLHKPHPLRNNFLHHLRRPAADRDQADIAGEPGDVVLLHVAVPAVSLQALVGDLLGEVAGEEFCH